MAASTKAMHQIRQIFELRQQQVSLRKIERLTGFSRNTVRDDVRRASSGGRSFSDLLALDDTALAGVLFGDESPLASQDPRWADLEQRLSALSRELHKTGVTKWLLWEEYRREQPNGYSYTQFSLYLRRFLQQQNAVMHLRHSPGEVMMVDFAGDRLRWIDPKTGEEHLCEVLVCTLPFSSLTYAEALPSQKQKASRYEPVFTEAFELRNEEFHALSALNAAILKHLDRHNTLPFKGRSYSRRDIFEQEERAILRLLPPRPYQIQHVVWAKVQRNYHVILGEDRHQYSVPFALIGKTLKMMYTADTVEVYHNLLRVAVHRRDARQHTYTTLAEHMPANHRHWQERQGWTPDYFLNKARQVGPATLAALERILTAKAFLEQTYNTCLGILKLANRYGNDRLEAACRYAGRRYP
jgi:transposase